jgi:hypothetical protein
VGIAEVIALVVATAALVFVAGPAVAAAAAAIGRTAATAALVLSLGMAELANAADDSCSCTPEPRSRRGGNLVHNACADLPRHTSFPGEDRYLDGRSFDGQLLAQVQMTEVKTGTFYSLIAAISDSGRPSAVMFRYALMKKQEAIIVRDTGIAGICKFDYGYYAVDGRLISDLQKFLLSLASKAHATTCQ